MAPMKNTTERHMNSQIPKSIKSDPLSTAPARVTGLPETNPAGGLEAADIKPGISPALCQAAMPSVQTSVSASILPLAMNARSWASG
jgi:hypothetical protein